MSTLPESSKVVVIGGGIVGCSTAYHLAQSGAEVVLLERHKITSGTTFHAAGLVGQLRSSANITQLLGYSVELYKKLESETGQGTGWKMNGGLRLACNQERWTEVKRQATTAHSFGLDMQLLSPKEAQALWPMMSIDDVVGAAYLPTDGQANPADITLALAKGARQAGALLLEDTSVLDLVIDKQGVRAVVTDQGTIHCEKVVCCAGQWTREFAARFGVTVPLVSVQHQYIVTDRIDGVMSDLPTLRDPDRLTYYKEEVGGLVMGGYESNPIPWAVDGIPDNFHFSLLDTDIEHFEPMLNLAIGRVPALAEVGIKQMINGPESFTPDGHFILGEAPELRQFFVGAGFNAYGIAAAGGAGMALAEWVRNGAPPFDCWGVDIRRFGRPHTDTDWVRTRTLEAYGKHYTMAWPMEEATAGRPCRRSPLYDTLKAQGACFGEKLGWERPNWFADIQAGESAVDQYTFQVPNWHSAVAREHHAVRNAAVLIDQTSFAKYLLKGPDALQALNWLAANDVDKPTGSLTYTQLLDENGGIQADVTVARLADDEFYIVTGTGFATHDYDWISRQLPDNSRAQLFDMTSACCVLSLMGPRSREILQTVTRHDVSNDAFPFATMQRIGIHGCPVNALRITYVGELGWELHLPVEYALTVYKALIEAGKPLGLINAGYRVIETCRLEKGYRAWGSDIGPDHTPIEAGLGWALKVNKSEVPFLGRDAVLKQQQQGIKKKLAGFTVS
nr:FAD-dependent oxidoreductase [Granulosicoccus sp.]